MVDYSVPHNRMFDEQITQMIESHEYGDWHTEDGRRVFTPRMSFFADVPPVALTTYFLRYGGDDLRLNLP